MPQCAGARRNELYLILAYRCIAICTAGDKLTALVTNAVLLQATCGYKPSSSQMLSTRCLTAAVMLIVVPHSRCVSPGHLLVASIPILLPRPLTGEAKSR